MMNNVRDNLVTDVNICITSGSFGESIEMKGSDIDVMHVLKEIKVYETMSSVVKENDKTYFSMNMEETKPGFTSLLLEYTHAVDVLPMCTDVRGRIFLSNVKFKKRFEQPRLNVDHGPCLSDHDSLYDYCFCLHSESWITSANQWIIRPNNSWPSPEITLFEPSPNLDIPLLPFICSFQQLANSNFLLMLKQNFFLMGNTRKGYVRAVHNLLNLQSTRIQYIYLYFMSALSENMPKAIPQIKRDGNKYFYKQYNTYLSYLLQNTHQDCVSEWLILAALFYKTQQYNKVLYLTLYSLSKCTSEKLCQGKDLTDIQIELLSLKTIQKKGKINLLKLLKVQSCAFGRTFLIPTELQMNVPIGELKFFPILPAVVSAHFLRVLCHYHLNNLKQCRKSVSALGLTIAEEYFIPKLKSEKSDSYDCLGVALQLIGETENAKQAFVRSIELKPEQVFNLSYKRLYEIVKGVGRVLVLKKPNFQYMFED
ncbi:unnamed protein product [Mytilus coruscus]|uniref:Uncharacterized protein n=1 Tax=Mytilus coruscus TaxID=42192 RepID=A0A6J8F0B3_MYTCO|nr:unnamed protein product [Mytilus coruscus]